jgi:hypothetical protein
MTDLNVPKGEKIERRGARPGPRRGPKKSQFTIRLTQQEEDYLVESWGWVQAGIETLVRGSMDGTLVPVRPPSAKKQRRKKRS